MRDITTIISFQEEIISIDDKYIRALTKYNSLSEMMIASGYKGDCLNSFLESDKWSHFVQKSTDFNSFEDLIVSMSVLIESEED